MLFECFVGGSVEVIKTPSDGASLLNETIVGIYSAITV